MSESIAARRLAAERLSERRLLLLNGHGRITMRAMLAGCLERADRADVAVVRIRLAALDFTASELRHVRRCRVLLGRLDVDTLVDFAATRDPHGRDAIEHLHVLRGFVRSGRLAVRSANLELWEPDFSIFEGVRLEGAELRRRPFSAVLLGGHYFARPGAPIGAAMTCATTDPSAVCIARARFGELWGRGHDVLDAVAATLDERLAKMSARP